MKAILSPLPGILAVVLLLPPDLQAEVYKWVDKNGTVHFTDNPEELPEPHRSRALRKLEEEARAREEAQRKKGSESRSHSIRGRVHDRIPPDNSSFGLKPVTRPSSTTDDAAARAKKKRLWKTRMAQARRRVATIEEECRQIEIESQQSSRSSLIYARPADRQKAAESTRRLSDCRDRLAKAKHDLEVALPQKARRQGVPPGWLR